MVNIEEFSKRLTLLMDYNEISAAQLAERIDVQRSSISHILSGRNKPSLDFVLKILKAFPGVELYWLLNGVGSYPNEKKDGFDISYAPIENIQKEVSQTHVQENPIIKTQEAISKDFPSNSTESEIDRIVIFFKDGTFKNYTP